MSTTKRVLVELREWLNEIAEDASEEGTEGWVKAVEVLDVLDEYEDWYGDEDE